MQSGQVVSSSYTHRKVAEAAMVKLRILEGFKITKDEYTFLLFDTGVKFATKVMPYDVALAFMTNNKSGFWIWWKYIWLLDDENILNLSNPFDVKYFELKQALIEDEFTEYQFRENFKI